PPTTPRTPTATATATPTPTGTCMPNDYTITTTTGTIVPGTTDTGNHCDDCITAITLPFPVHFYDQTYTTANLSSNGNIQFVSANDNDLTNLCLPTAVMNYLLAPYWSDLYDVDGPLGQGIFTSVSGTAP